MSAHIDLAEPAAEPSRARAAGAPAATGRKEMTLAAKIGAITAALVAIPALLNGAVDVYRAVANVPTSFQDKTNEELFKQHFGELPLLAQKIGIKRTDATVDMFLEVYSGGDILVRYGGKPQWFRAKAAERLAANLFFISSAHAQVPPAAQVQGSSAMRTVVRPAVTIDLDKVQSQRSARVGVDVVASQPPPAATLSTIERAYLIAETRDEHTGLSVTAATNTKVFRAEPGYRIVGHEFQLSTANQATITSIKQSPDGQLITVTYTIKSGPAYDRWRGWIKGTLQTSQAKIAS